MSLFGSLFTGVSGLGAQSQATAMIANNIANINTTGFKRSEASFFSLVTTEGRSSKFSPGTVSVNRVQRVDQQGPIQQTASTTDVAISGNGLLAVKRDPDATNQLEFLYTRSGSFSEDKEGNLRNTAGFLVYGVAVDSITGVAPAVSDVTQLVPVNVGSTSTGNTRPTTAIELSLNLNASSVDNTLGAIDPSTSTTAPDFSRTITVFDSLGGAQPLTLEFTKTYGPQATAAGNVSGLLASNNLITDLLMTVGDQFNVGIDGGPTLRTYQVSNTIPLPPPAAPPGVVEVSTVADIINDINANAPGVSAFLGNDGEFVFQRDNFQGGAAQTVDIAEVIPGTALSRLGFVGFPLGPFVSNDLNNATYDNGGPADVPTIYGAEEFPAFTILPGDPNYNSRGWWQTRIVHPDGTTLSNGLINFNGDGSLNAQSSGNPSATDINLTGVVLKAGAAPQNIDIDINNFSQFSGSFNVNFTDQNGAALGLRTGLEITRDGLVVARFSNGSTTDLFKIPLIKFNNVNGLSEVSGTAYVESSESGSTNANFAGEGGAGFFEPSTVESSNVDLAEEFAKLIVSQRAFTSNTRIINTVDSMTEDLLRII